MNKQDHIGALLFVSIWLIMFFIDMRAGILFTFLFIYVAVITLTHE